MAGSIRSARDRNSDGRPGTLPFRATPAHLRHRPPFDVVALKVQGVGVKFPGKWISVYDEQLRATQGVDGNRSTDRRVRHGIYVGGF